MSSAKIKGVRKKVAFSWNRGKKNFLSPEVKAAANVKLSATLRKKFKGHRAVTDEGYIVVFMPGHPLARKSGHVFEHRLIAEKALGRPLPKGAVIHHVGAKDDQKNLVICQDNAYHGLLHRRARAYAACGHAEWLKCWDCRSYGPEDSFYAPPHGRRKTTCLACMRNRGELWNIKQKMERRIKNLRKMFEEYRATPEEFR